MRLTADACDPRLDKPPRGWSHGTMQQNWDDPEINWRVVKALLITAPFLFAGSYLLALVQRASHFHSLVIAGIALAGCLGTAAIIHLFRSSATYVFGGLAVAIGLLAALFGR